MKWIKRISYFLAIVFIIAAMIVSVSRLLTPLLNSHKDRFEQWAEAVLQTPVSIGTVHITWYFYHPQLTLEQVSLLDKTSHQPILAIEQVKINLDWLSSLIHQKAIIHFIKISSVELTVKETSWDHFSIKDLGEFSLQGSMTGSALPIQQAKQWLYAVHYLIIDVLTINYSPLNGPFSTFSLRRLSLRNKANHHELTLNGILQTHLSTYISMGMTWTDEVSTLSAFSANIQIALKSFSLSQISERALFENAAVLDHIDTHIHIEKNEEGAYKITLPDFQVNNAECRVTGNLNLTVPINDSPSIDLNAKFSLSDMQHLIRYLPLKILEPDFSTWLKQAFLSGKMANGHAVIKGKWADFPFTNQTGEFTVQIMMDQLDLQFAPDWPIIKNIQSRLLFSGSQMQGDIMTGNMQAIPLKSVQFLIPYIGPNHPQILIIHSAINADLQKGMDFIKKSPLNKIIGKEVAPLVLTGNSQLLLNLSIPVKKPEKLLLKGELIVSKIKLLLPEWNLLYKNVSGSLFFSESGIQLSTLNGILFEQPAKVTVVSVKNNSTVNYLKINIASAIKPIELSKWSQISFPFATGILPYTAELNLFPDSSKEVSQLILQSTLQGMSLDLPLALNKKANEKINFAAKLVFHSPEQIQATINYASLVLAQLQIKKNKGEYAIAGGNIQLNTNVIRGTIKLPEMINTGKITAALDYLYLGLADSRSQSSTDPRKLYNMNLSVTDMRYGDSRLGKVDLDVYKVPDGIKIASLQLDSDNYHLNAKGTWTIQQGGIQQTGLTGSLSTNDLGLLLEQFNVKSSDLVGGKGNIQFDLSEMNSPYNIILGDLAGNVAINIKDGRIIHLSRSTNTKMGVGKILSVFSLQTLPRRLSLNFSDLMQKGYSFDTCESKISLKSGHAYLQDTHIEGPTARVDILGRIGLVDQDVDINLSVTPYVTSSLPLVATIAGGPVLGLVTWAVDRVVSSGITKATTYHYSITGSLAHPLWRSTSAF